MREDLEELNSRELFHFPVLLGGAALTRRYVEEDLRGIYKGSVYYAQEEYVSAIKHYQRAASLDPRYATPQGQIGWIYYVQRQYLKAQPYLEQAAALETQPLRKAQYLHVLGWINLKAGNKSEARQDFTQALALDPSLQGARDGLQALGG